jgi:hypothetical protein
LNQAIGLVELIDQFLVLLLQSLNLLPLTLAGGLCCPPIPEDTLDSALLLFVFCLGTLSGKGLESALGIRP